MNQPDVTDASLARRIAELGLQNADLRARLDEAEQTLGALRDGEVDAIVVGDAVYTLESASAAANRFRADVLAQMAEAVVATDTDGRITYLNPAAERMFDQAASRVLGRELDCLYRVDGHGGTAAPAPDPDGWHGQTLICADSRQLFIESAICALRDADGAPIGRFAVMRDVSDRMRAAQALRLADRRKDEFLATLAHELRSPLAPITTSLMIMSRVTSASDIEASRRVIERQVRQLVRLVDDLLDLSRVSQGKMLLRAQPMDVTSAILAAIETSRPLIERQQHALTLELSPAPLPVLGDLTRLTQVFANILDNAAKYTARGGTIHVRSTLERDCVRVSVRDNGVGLRADALEGIFEMFVQVGDDNGTRHAGLGIGLALVRQLVALHGGSVSAHSDGPGAGVEMIVRLPLAEPAAPPPAEPVPDHGSRRQAPARALRVLVADDNADSVESLAFLLRLMGCEVVTAADGLEAVERARAFRPELALLDIGMPRLDGNAAARRMRSELPPSLMLIALTGWGQPEDRSRSAAAGFDHHLVKPVDPVMLEQLIASRIGRG